MRVAHWRGSVSHGGDPSGFRVRVSNRQAVSRCPSASQLHELSQVHGGTHDRSTPLAGESRGRCGSGQLGSYRDGSAHQAWAHHARAHDELRSARNPRVCFVWRLSRVYDFATSEKFRPEFVSEPAVDHLHGQHSCFVQLHTEQEVKQHFKRLTPVFEDAGTGRTWTAAALLPPSAKQPAASDLGLTTSRSEDALPCPNASRAGS